MHRSINIIQKAAMAVLALVLAAGCILEKDGPSMDAQDVMVQLNVSAGEMQTKAINESAIKTIRIFAYDKAGKLVGHIYKDTPTADEAMHMVLSVPGDQPTVSVDFYAVANEGAMYYGASPVSLSDNMTIDELNAIVYNSLVITEETLPLYGKIVNKTLTLSNNVHNIDGHYGLMVVESVSIDLSRSLAKIGVYAAAVKGAEKDPVIHSVTLVSSGRRNSSYLFPAADDASLKTRDASVTSLPEDRVFDSQNDGEDVLSNSGVVSKRLASHNTDPTAVVTDYYTEVVSPFYLAEVPYGSTDWTTAADASGRPVVLVVEYSLGESSVKNYATVNMPAIERNSFYQVRCLIKSDGQIQINVSVNPWNIGESWDISFEFPTHSDPLLATSTKNPDGTYQDHVYGTEATMYFKDGGEAGAFCVDFNMSYPIGGHWMPSLSGASNEDFELRMYKRDDSVMLTDNDVTVSSATKDQWYTIKVVPLKSENVGKKVTLSISYTPLYVGTGYSYLLQINGGEETNLAWAEKNPSATDNYEASTVDIVITQVDTI